MRHALGLGTTLRLANACRPVHFDLASGASASKVTSSPRPMSDHGSLKSYQCHTVCFKKANTLICAARSFLTRKISSFPSSAFSRLWSSLSSVRSTTSPPTSPCSFPLPLMSDLSNFSWLNASSTHARDDWLLKRPQGMREHE